MATQPSANPKNLFAFLLGMLTLTQGLVLPTESLLQRRAAKVQKRMSFKRAARSDLDAPISPLLSPVSRPCSLGCEVRYPSPTSYCGAQLEHSCFRIRRSWPENGLSVRRSPLNPNNRTWDG